MAELTPGSLEVDVEEIALKGPDRAAVDAIHARPDGMPHSGLVVHPDIGGLRPLFDDLCRRLATHGFAVCCPEPFVRAPSTVRAGDVETRIAYLAELDDDLQLGDLEAAADYLVVHDDVREVSVLGFCMGGMQALKAAATGRFDRAVTFYGIVDPPAAWIGPRTKLPLATASEVCPTLGIFGGRDDLVPAAAVAQLQAAWADRPDCEVVLYPDGEHGFVHDPERPTHRADDAADAWRRALAFLRPD
jgi:carboxymethylenebutenolidase